MTNTDRIIAHRSGNTYTFGLDLSALGKAPDIGPLSTGLEDVVLPPAIIHEISLDVERYRNLRINAAKKRIKNKVAEKGVMLKWRREAFIENKYIIPARFLAGESLEEIAHSYDLKRVYNVVRNLRWFISCSTPNLYNYPRSKTITREMVQEAMDRYVADPSL